MYDVTVINLNVSYNYYFPSCNNICMSFFSATSSEPFMGAAISSEDDDFEITPENRWLHQKSTVRAPHRQKM